MQPNSIPGSTLLDIIFENRNKDYGAYVLRKNYNKRLLTALVMVLALIGLFIFSQFPPKENEATKLLTVPFITDLSISPVKHITKKTEIKNIPARAKPAKALSNKWVIVKDDKITKESPASVRINTLNTDKTETRPVEEDGTDGRARAAEIKRPLNLSVPVADSSAPFSFPEMLPHFPGGINELIKFLKQNLRAPQELEEEEVAVKIKFIVNYNGYLMGFEVVETGGQPFDNEVIRVLKKMPKWIPGKTMGKDVSAYFTIPVKFTIYN